MSSYLSLSSASFGRRFYLASAALVLVLLLTAHIALLVLWIFDALSARTFRAVYLNRVQQIIQAGSQASIIVLTAALAFVAELLSSDQILRRSKLSRLLVKIPQDTAQLSLRIVQPVAAIQDNLVAWQGLGSSLMALWHGRRLGSDVRSRIAAVSLFFLAISVLQIVTPVLVTINATNTTITSSSTVDRFVVDKAKAPALFNFSSDLDPKSAFGPRPIALAALPYVWDQRNSTLIGVPPGLNGTLVPSINSNTYIPLLTIPSTAYCLAR